MDPIRVLIVDDSSVVRRLLREALASAEDIVVAGAAPDGQSALEMLAAVEERVAELLPGSAVAAAVDADGRLSDGDVDEGRFQNHRDGCGAGRAGGCPPRRGCNRRCARRSCRRPRPRARGRRGRLHRRRDAGVLHRLAVAQHLDPLQQAPRRLPLLLKLLPQWYALASATTLFRCQRFVNSRAHI